MSASLVYMTVSALRARSWTQDSATFPDWAPKVTPLDTAGPK